MVPAVPQPIARMFQTVVVLQPSSLSGSRVFACPVQDKRVAFLSRMDAARERHAMHSLTIEADDMVPIAIEDALRDGDFTSFDFAPSLGDAITAARVCCPQLITADPELRPGSGIDPVETICSDASTPVIFITGRAEAARSRMPQHRVLTKPFRPVMFADRCNTCCVGSAANLLAQEAT